MQRVVQVTMTMIVSGEVAVAVYASRVGVAASIDIWSCREHMWPQSVPPTERRSKAALAEQPIITWPSPAAPELKVPHCLSEHEISPVGSVQPLVQPVVL